jgi:arginase
MRSGRFPLVVAGECSVLLGSLAASRDVHGDVGLVFVDGHEDVWPPKSSPTGEVSDMELGLALGRHGSDVPAALRSELPLVGFDSVVALGPRDHQEMEDAGVSSIRSELWFADDRQLAEATIETTARALSHLELACETWWLHVDLDVLSTDALPAVDYLQPGGLSWDQLKEVTSIALRDPRVVGADVTIFNPDLDPTGAAAHRIVDYLARAFARDSIGTGR